jgi:hypothetical protein
MRLSLRNHGELGRLLDTVVAMGSRCVGQRDVELEEPLDERQALDVEAHLGVSAVRFPAELREITLRAAEQRAGDVAQLDRQARRVDRLPVLHPEP